MFVIQIHYPDQDLIVADLMANLNTVSFGIHFGIHEFQWRYRNKAKVTVFRVAFSILFLHIGFSIPLSFPPKNLDESENLK